MNPVNAPDRQPDLSKDNGLKIWFEEMLCCTKITTRAGNVFRFHEVVDKAHENWKKSKAESILIDG